MRTLEEQIKKLIASFQQLPFLFIGTGISIRYADAPSWDNLLYKIWSYMNGEDKKKFNRMLQRIEFELGNRLSEVSEEDKKYYINPEIATELQKQFNHLYYNDDSFYINVFDDDESNEVITNKYDPFKYYIAKLMKSLVIKQEADVVNELTPFKSIQNKIAGIITTNYDCMLENIFTDFNIIIGQDNLLLSNANNIFEIYKIHGSTTAPNSIVITQSDYKYFDEKLKYLSAKLLTIFVEHPIIFMGYGLGDLNIIKLFTEIALCLNSEQLEKTKNNFIFITPASGMEEDIRTKELAFGNKRVYMTELILNDYSIFYKELLNIQSSLPIKMVRKLQDMITNYIYSTEAKNDIIFGSINSPDIDDSKAAIYVGTTETISQIGFDYFTIDDILEDILFNNKPYLVDEKLLTKTFKNFRSISGTTFLPVYKYLRALNISIEDIPSNYLIVKRISDIKPNYTEETYVNKQADYHSLEDILLDNPNHLPKQFANIKYFSNRIKAEDLGDYLRDHFRKRTFFEYSRKSTFRKLTALYDFKKYK
jgi:hypothetical protein